MYVYPAERVLFRGPICVHVRVLRGVYFLFCALLWHYVVVCRLCRVLDPVLCRVLHRVMCAPVGFEAGS